jgi:hypothetical protein
MRRLVIAVAALVAAAGIASARDFLEDYVTLP